MTIKEQIKKLQDLLTGRRDDLSDYHAGWHNGILEAIESLKEAE